MLAHYYHRLKNLSQSRVLAKKHKLKLMPGLTFGPCGTPKCIQKVVFDFSDPRLIHLGDQLFHHGLLHALQSNSKIDTLVITTQLEFYYSALGIKTIHPKKLDPQNLNNTLIISKAEMLKQIHDRNCKDFYFMGYSYNSLAETCRIGSAISNSSGRIISSILNTPHSFDTWPTFSLDNSKPSKEVTTLLEQCNQNQPIYLFNDYVASSYLSAHFRRKHLRNFAREFSKQGNQLIYVSSKQDLLQHSEALDFIKLDARGKLSLLDIFDLLSQPSIAGILSFDTFIAHAAALLNKKMFVFSRSKIRKEKFRQKFIPAHESQLHLLQHFE